MNRISVTMLRNAFARYVRSCEAWGYDVTGWQMTEGSNGEAYRVGTSGKAYNPNTHPGIDSYGIIGYSRRESYETLNTICRVLSDLPFNGK
ncbi:hypothetical protein PP460_gp021 [Streptomyces phage Muntaha]|uniref:Uncharacterized protein n=1 Tax=Streptomyces phage Muntaha TaxID=2713269 RepID=A0A6G8R3N0_9CAUD|nr:hypothetical protein PP460_gp021 [Streptomyces phage Muntaha]QIN94781.1 hypothetical protein SEA_MUNTAHA_258 [Streptomyces phage Muntaha]